jgi:SulP family sulfate permease
MNLSLRPWLQWQARLNRVTLRQDLAAGLTGALIVLPQGMAYAVIAGLPPAFGLYCALVPTVIAALFGSSMHMISGPTAAISIVVSATLTPYAVPGSSPYIQMALTLGLMVGLLQIGMALMGLGKLTHHISHSVIVGFTTGAACLIAVGQVKYFLGLSLPSGNSFFPTLIHSIKAIHQVQWPVLAVGLVTLLTSLLVRRLWPRWPYMVVGMAAGTLLAWLWDDPRIQVVGHIPSAFPPLSSPSTQWEQWQQLSLGAGVIAILALTEAIAIARALGLRSGQQIQGNQETLAQGLSNAIGAFFSGYPSSGSFTRSGVNLDAGAQTPMAAIFSALCLLALLMVIAPVLRFMPLSAMAAVLFVVAWGLIDRRAIAHCFVQRQDALIFSVTFGACLLTNIEYAVFGGVGLSLLLNLMKRLKS